MNIKEIVETYLSKKGLKRYGSNDNDAMPILPFLIMDVALQLWMTYVNDVKCKHEMQKFKKRWRESWHSFNMEFFTKYDKKNWGYILTMMDDFETFIGKDVKIAFLQFTNILKSESIDRQKVLAACMVINVLCQCSQIIWERVYDTSGAYKVNKNLDKCEKAVDKWKDIYYGKNTPSVDCNTNKEIVRSVDILCNRLIEFLRKYLEKPTIVDNYL